VSRSTGMCESDHLFFPVHRPSPLLGEKEFNGTAMGWSHLGMPGCEALQTVAGGQESCSIQQPIANRFCEVAAFDVLRSIQIRDGTCQFQYAVKGARRELQFFHRLAE
jgi:hypothetical protein